MIMSVNVYNTMLVKEKEVAYDLDTFRIASPYDAVQLINNTIKLNQQSREFFVMLTLSTKNTVLGLHVVHMGSLNASIVHPREVFQQAILNNAASIMVFHNHPSGDTTPSNEDIIVTRRLKEAGKIIGIELLDHIIVGNGFTSLKERGDI